MALHKPEFADKLQKLGEQLRFNTRYPKRISELVIMTVGRHWNSYFVWFVHEPIALAAGVPASVIEDLRANRTPVALQEDEREVYDYCTSLLRTGFVAEPKYQAIVKRWGPAGVVELTGLVGYYCMNSLSINAHDLYPMDAPLPFAAGPALPGQ